MGDGLWQLERLLADALIAGDVRLLRAGAAALLAELQHALGHDDDAGFQLAALLVAKLCFERLIQGSTGARAAFAADPAAFTAAFRRYHREVPPLAHDRCERTERPY